MRLVCVSFVAGVAIVQHQAFLLSFPTVAMVIAVAIPAFLVVRFLVASHRHALQWRLGAASLLALIVGYGWATAFAHYYLRSALPVAWESKDIVLVGTIDSLPTHMAEGQRFIFAVEEVRENQMTSDERAHFPQKIMLSWYQTASVGSASLPLNLMPGERWQLKVRLKRPHGTVNPDGFDYEVWLLEQGIRATGAVRDHGESTMPINQRLDPFVWRVGYVIERGRAALRDRIHAALAGAPYAGVIVALVIGDQREIPQSDWTVFNRVGIGHLISISGLHITMVAGLFSGLLSFLWRRSFFTDGALPLYMPVQKVAALASAWMALIYVALAGFGIPSQRTMYMLMVVALALWTGRIGHFSAILCLALCLVTLLDPWAVLSPGFWLSFGAVAVIVFAAGGQLPPHAQDRAQQLRQALRAASRTQYAVTLGLVPLTMLLFGQVSLIGPVANAIAIPLVSFLVTPLALLGSIAPHPLAHWILALAHCLIEALVFILRGLSDLPVAVWSAALPSFAVFVIALIGTLWVLMPAGWPMRWLGLVCWLPLIFSRPTPVNDRVLRVIAFDVGQGMALLLETAHHRLLYDTGPMYSPESDAGSRVVLPYLKARGIDALDMLMVSHNDSDHSGGALTILKQMPIGMVSSSLALDSPIVMQASRHQRCRAGQSWDWDGVHFSVLQPAAASYESNKWRPNARSCTLRVSTDHFSLLLPGDIDATQEDELVNSIADQLTSDVLLAPHHGSGTSSTPAFLRAVHPSLAIFQVGYLNRYHHPKPEIYDRYEEFGINRLRTDVSGAITLQFGALLQFSQFRQEHARYWYLQ